MEMVEIAWLDWMMVGSVILLSNLNPLRLMGYNTLIANFSDAKGSVMSGNKVIFSPKQLA